jgi:ribose 5-phosphate isomerase B
MKIGIASDHSGIELKKLLIDHLQKNNYEVKNYGTDTVDSVDYPDYAFKIGEAVRDHIIDMGILICRTGIGMSMACNKVHGSRCAHVASINDAKMTRIDNNANVVSFGCDMDPTMAISIVDTFLTTPTSTEERHQRRVAKIDNYRG